MARTLDANLAAAQDLASRRPLVEIVSAQRTADIPFDGSMLTAEAFDEYGVNLIPHSSGSLVLSYIYYSGTTSGIKFVYTDTGRTEFTTVDLPLYTYAENEIKAVSICELTGGNIGLVLLVDDKTNHLYRLTRRIYTVAGVAVSDAEIANWSHDTWTSDPWVATVSGSPDSYLIVYGKIEASASPDHYHLYERTSSDFLTWAAEAELSIASVDETYRKANPSIVEISTGDLWLWFDVLEATGPMGEELTNIYYSVSSDGGGTWGAAVKVTAYDSYSEIGKHPVAVQKAANQMQLIYTREVGALHLDDTSTGWPTGDSTVELSWDSVNRKLYAINCYNRSGIKTFQCVVKIDVDTWTVDKYWDSTTTPGFPSFMTDGSHNAWYGVRFHDGNLVCLTCIDADHRFLWVLDGEADTITGYYFDTQAGHSITANVSSIPGDGWSAGETYNILCHAFVSAAENRVYLAFVNSYIYHPGVVVGYIDLTEISDFQFHAVVTSRDYQSEAVLINAIPGTDVYGGGLFVDTTNHYIILTSGSGAVEAYGGLVSVWDLDSGALVVDWAKGDSDFPRYGLSKPLCYNGRIYAGMTAYTSGYGQSNFRGLAEIDIAAETITMHRPSYCSDDDHFLGRPAYLQDGKIAMTHRDYGVAIFDTIAKTWELFSNDNIPGMTSSGADDWMVSQILYDDTNDLVMVGDPGHTADASGVVLFSIHGFLRQAYYSIGTNPGGGWTFATPAQLVQGYLDYDAAAAVEPGSSTAMYVFWTNETVDAEQSVKWDQDGSSKDLSSWIVGEVAFERSISGKPATLAFSVSDGHLFDPYNRASLYSIYLRKGRKLTLRFGETVSGTAYWENQGSFFVTAASLAFERGKYPLMEVQAEDQRCLWAHSHIYVTDIYNNLPDEIIEDILTDQANLAAGDLNIPVFVGGTALQMQWIETTVDEILNQVCNRFGYFFRFDMDGNAHARQITGGGSIDHTYTDNAKVLRFTPDDRYSDFTNRVTVQGQELDFTQVTFTEERVGAVNGTVGWWGFRKDFQIWFSDDKSRRCINPRLGVRETATSITFQLAGDISETLTECAAGDDNKFCTITVTAPNLIPLLVASIAMIGSGLAIGDGVTTLGSLTIPVGKVIEKAGLITALMVLGSTGNFQYEVFAQPLGQVRRSVQATWNDTEHQTEIDAVVEQKIQDPLCYSAADCLAVATFEGTVAQMQRRRVMIEKTAHLQDEEGDTIRVVHPCSGQTMDLYVASLKRKFKKADPGGGDGYFLDEIEGWAVSG